MISKMRLLRRGFGLTGTILLCGFLYGADSVVPANWNVAPMRDGAYLEAFEGSTHTWATLIGYNVVTNVFPTMSGSNLPVRSNAWFDANAKVLQLDTDGGVVTNALVYSGEAPVTFSTKPVYVDFRIKFDAMTDEVGDGLTENIKIALYLKEDCKLVALHGGGATTNSTPVDTNKWHQLTMKLADGKCDVLLNDVVVFTDLTLKDNGSANTLNSANFYGTGYIDELYVSHGDPAYDITGPTAALTATLPAAGDNPPTDEQQTLINVWLQGKPAITDLSSMTQDQLSHAYLLNDVLVDQGTASAVGYDFGISEFEMISPTSIKVKVFLTTNDTLKQGTINGKIQLLGKINYSEATWTLLDGCISPSLGEFTDGVALYDFTIPGGGYRFFKPLIVP